MNCVSQTTRGDHDEWALACQNSESNARLVLGRLPEEALPEVDGDEIAADCLTCEPNDGNMPASEALLLQHAWIRSLITEAGANPQPDYLNMPDSDA